jgi:hypothetical protein
VSDDKQFGHLPLDPDLRARASEMGALDPDHAPCVLPPTTVEQAKETLKHMLAARPDCDACDVMAFDAVFEGVALAHGGNPPRGAAQLRLQELFDEGWAPLAERAGIVKRCSTCASTSKYPWAEKVDPVRAAAWMNVKRGINGEWAYDLTGLKELVEP